MSTKSFAQIGLLALSVAAIAGCHKEYENQRPPVDQLDARDRGLQSKDVVNASDQMAMSLLQLPELNASDHRWTVVFTGVRNKTTSTATQNLDIFVSRLKANVARQAHGKVQIIANRNEFHELQSMELEPATAGERDDYQQGGRKPTPRPGMAGIQPDFALEAVATDLPNRGTNYYNFEFHLINYSTREEVWTDAYEVRVAK